MIPIGGRQKTNSVVIFNSDKLRKQKVYFLLKLLMQNKEAMSSPQCVIRNEDGDNVMLNLRRKTSMPTLGLKAILNSRIKIYTQLSD